jgi:hypothetical protein
MMTKWMALGLLLAGSGAFAATAAPKETPQTVGSLKLLRSEIKRDEGDIAAKVKTERGERKQLLDQEKTEIAKIRQASGNRSEKKQARAAVRAKYARLLQDARQKSLFERKQLRDDMASKGAQIKKLRSS